MQGGMVLYAQNTKNQTYIDRVKKHLDYWTYNVTQLEGGLRWIDHGAVSDMQLPQRF